MYSSILSGSLRGPQGALQHAGQVASAETIARFQFGDDAKAQTVLLTSLDFRQV
jgi:hypothetical protein